MTEAELIEILLNLDSNIKHIFTEVQIKKLNIQN